MIDPEADGKYDEMRKNFRKFTEELFGSLKIDGPPAGEAYDADLNKVVNDDLTRLFSAAHM